MTLSGHQKSSTLATMAKPKTHIKYPIQKYHHDKYEVVAIKTQVENLTFPTHSHNTKSKLGWNIRHSFISCPTFEVYPIHTRAIKVLASLQWHHNEHGGISNYWHLDCLLRFVCSGADQRKHQSSASLAFVLGIHWWPVNSQHKGPVTRKMFPFDGVIMMILCTDRQLHGEMDKLKPI